MGVESTTPIYFDWTINFVLWCIHGDTRETCHIFLLFKIQCFNHDAFHSTFSLWELHEVQPTFHSSPDSLVGVSTKRNHRSFKKASETYKAFLNYWGHMAGLPPSLCLCVSWYIVSPPKQSLPLLERCPPQRLLCMGTKSLPSNYNLPIYDTKSPHTQNCALQ